MTSQDADYKKIELIMDLRNRGIVDRKLLSVIERIPREMFLAKAFAGQAYADQSLPIECGQTISQPYIVAYLTSRHAQHRLAKPLFRHPSIDQPVLWEFPVRQQ